jgi:hypothetical protein
MIMSRQDAGGPNEHEKTRHWSGALPAMSHLSVCLTLSNTAWNISVVSRPVFVL